MNTTRGLSFLAAALILLGIGVFMLQPAAPQGECVPEGEPYSGWMDPDQDNCPISEESYREILDWETSPKPFRMAGAGIALVGIGFGVAAGVKAVRGKKPGGDPGAGHTPPPNDP